MKKLILVLSLLFAIPAFAQDYTFGNVYIKGGNPWIDIKAAGAKGDNTADDTAAIQAALVTCSSNNGTLFFPRGAYKITTALSVTSNCHIMGELWSFGTTINVSGAVGCFNFNGPGAGGGFVFGVIIEDLTCEMTAASAFTGAVINMGHVYQTQINRVRISPVPNSSTARGIACQACSNVQLNSNVIYGPTPMTNQPIGVYIAGDVNSSNLVTMVQNDIENLFYNTYVSYDSRVDIYSTYGEGSAATLYIHPNALTSVDVYGGTYPTVNGSTFSMINDGGSTSSLRLHDPHIAQSTGANLISGLWSGSYQLSFNGGAYSTVTSLVTTTVGALPAAAAGNKGYQTAVSDSTAVAVEGQTCVGGSTNTAMAFSNGVIWKCF